MSDLSDVSNDEIREILGMIRAKTDNSDIDDETVRQWSREDIDRLLEASRHGAERAKAQSEVPSIDGSIYIDEQSFADAGENEPEMEHFFGSVATVENDEIEELDAQPSDEEKAEDKDKRIRELMDGGENKRSFDISAVAGSAKHKLSSLFKKSSEKLSELFKSGQDEEEERFRLDEDDFDDGDEFDTTAEPDEADDEDDGDMKIADFSSKSEPTDEPTAEEKTIYIEKPGLVIKKGASAEDTELEGAPTIISADDALANDEKAKIPTIEKMHNDLQSKLREAQEDGQIIIKGFKDTAEETPGRIDEKQAELELFKKRKKKIDEFVLFGDDPYSSGEESEKIGELFDTHDDRPKRKEPEETFDGLEYAQTKDARRIQRYLNQQKKKSFRRMMGLCALFVISIITGIASSTSTTVGGDRFMTIFISMLTIMGALVISNQNILENFELLRKKRFNINTAISVSSILCFMQNLMMLVLYFFNNNLVSVFGCAGVFLLLMSEFNSYIVNSRTFDAMEICTGENKDKLYSIESISDGKDVMELGRNIRSKSPRIRYSCKTRFPSHLIEMCMSETSADRRSRIFLLALALMSVVNMIVAWVVNGNFTVGLAAFTITLSMCVPAYGALLVQLPLRWVNKKINVNGAMISCQESVNELYRTNAVVLDSKDLFDQSACVMHGYKDFKSVRMDDAILYATAMVVRSGGPLIGVFDQMVVNRRDILPTVKSFSYEEKLGVSGWIYNQKVILGNRDMMINHNVDVPLSIDEDKYLMRGHEVIYLAIADKLAAMMVVDYAPNKKIAPYLKKLRDSGVSVLVRNCDPNVTERMISNCYDMRLDNIKIINSVSGRVFKKYKSRPKVATKAVSVHDGSTYNFLRTLCMAASLRHTFKIADVLSIIGMVMGFAVVMVLSVLNVVADLPMIFVLLLQMVIAGVFVGVTRIAGGK